MRVLHERGSLHGRGVLSMIFDSLVLSLQGNVVVFDEAHNLVDAVNGAHSCNVGLTQLRGASRWESRGVSGQGFVMG